MKEVLYVDRFEQAEALFKPQRVEVLRQLGEPRTCTEVGAVLGRSAQRVYYHIQKLVDAGLVDRVSERRVRGIHEGIYQAGAKSYWLAPELVGRIGRRTVRDELSLGYLLSLVEQVHTDLAALLPAEGDAPTVGVSGEIRIRPGQRRAFLNELRATLQELFTRYGGAEGEGYRLAVACYPRRTDDG